MPPNSSKLNYLESVRGVAAFIVVISHLVLAFAPDLQTVGLPNRPPLSAIVADSPLSILYNGHASVIIFFVLSGFVLSIGYIRSRQVMDLSSSAIRRYFRLAIPVLFTVFLVHLVAAMGWFYHKQAGVMQSNPWLENLYNFQPGIWRAFREGSFGVWFAFDSTPICNPVLWTMPIELGCSFFVFCFLSLFGWMPRRALIYVITAILLILCQSPWVLCFLCGMALAEVTVLTPKWLSKIPRLAVLLILAASILLLSYKGPALHWGRFVLRIPGDSVLNAMGATMLFAVVLRSARLQALLILSPLVFLGRISFALYLLHLPTIATLGLGSYCYLRTNHWPHYSAAILSTLISIPACLIVAWLATKIVDSPSISLGKWIVRKFFPETITPAKTNPPASIRKPDLILENAR